MTIKRGDMPAIPVMDEAPEHGQHYGLTIREQFAMTAMQGLLASGGIYEFDGCAIDAVAHADALLAELEKSK